MADVPAGWTLVPGEVQPWELPKISCDTCGTEFAWLNGPEQEELPAHLAEHDVVPPEPVNPFDQFDRDGLLAWLQQTPLRSVHPSVRQMLVDRCAELDIPLDPYQGWLEGQRVADRSTGGGDAEQEARGQRGGSPRRSRGTSSKD